MLAASTVHDFGESDGLYYFIMEFVDGANLRQLLQAKKLTADQALAIVPKVCDALEYAHERGVVHRDLKPENVFLTNLGGIPDYPKVLAGIVKFKTQLCAVRDGSVNGEWCE